MPGLSVHLAYCTYDLFLYVIIGAQPSHHRAHPSALCRDNLILYLTPTSVVFGSSAAPMAARCHSSHGTFHLEGVAMPIACLR